MTEVWKDEYVSIPAGYDIFDETSQSKRAQNMMIDTSQPPRKYIKHGEKWCNNCNPESFGINNNLSHISELRCYNYVVKMIIENFNENKFYTKELRNIVDPNGISDGDRIRRILHFLTCIDIIRKELETTNELGKILKKPRYKICVMKEYKICEFYKKIVKKSGKVKYCCGFDWKNAEVTFYYDELKKEV